LFFRKVALVLVGELRAQNGAFETFGGGVARDGEDTVNNLRNVFGFEEVDSLKKKQNTQLIRKSVPLHAA
jgi:hypothetical protein